MSTLNESRVAFAEVNRPLLPIKSMSRPCTACHTKGVWLLRKPHMYVQEVCEGSASMPDIIVTSAASCRYSHACVAVADQGVACHVLVKPNDGQFFGRWRYEQRDPALMLSTPNIYTHIAVQPTVMLRRGGPQACHAQQK